MSDLAAHLRKALMRELETMRADLRSSAKLPDGYAHGFTNGRIDGLERALALLDAAERAGP